jgi:prepilin-type N-terminal cleavage/methylation domain-containing protein
MFRAIRKGEVGFTLVELLVVMAILTTLAGLVAGTVVGVGSRGQQARLDGDRDTIGKAAKRFSTEAFPETFPVVTLADTNESIKVTPDLGIRLVDFKRGLPQDPTKKFVPNFLNEIPDSSALVSWRIDTNSGNVFFAADGAPLIKPSNNRLDVEAADGTPGQRSNYTFELSMSKNEAALQTLKVRVPEGYSLGGQFAPANALVGVLSAKLDTDNEADSGNTIHFGGVIVATGTANEWKLVVNYNDNVSTSGLTNVAVKPVLEAVRVHTISIVPPSLDSSGTLTLKIARGSDKEHNKATEKWELTILGEATQELTTGILGIFTLPTGSAVSTGGLNSSARNLTTTAGYVVDPAAGNLIEPAVAILTNPSTKAVYRWLAEENTTIDPVVGTVEFFGDVPGSQGVLIKGVPIT